MDEAAPDDTATESRLAPAALIDPSVAATMAVCTLTRVMLAVATPALNVTLVAVPNAVPPMLGLMAFGETLAPLNVSDFTPA